MRNVCLAKTLRSLEEWVGNALITSVTGSYGYAVRHPYPFRHIIHLYEENSGKLFRMAPEMVLISSFAGSDCNAISGELGLLGQSWSLSKLDFSQSQSHILAYKSSCFMVASRSCILSCGVVRAWGTGWQSVNWRNHIRRSTWVLSVPHLRINYLMFSKTLSTLYGPVHRKSVKGSLLSW